jgi:hypothetical protein
MGFHDWFKSQPNTHNPEESHPAVFDGTAISVSHPDGSRDTLATAQLGKVAIATNDSGPWGIDCWWLLYSRGDQLAVRLPQGAPGEPAITKWLMSLPGFDHEQVVSAMCSAEDAIFPVWQLPQSQTHLALC